MILMKSPDKYSKSVCVCAQAYERGGDVQILMLDH